MKKRNYYSDYFMSQAEIAEALNISRAEVQQAEYSGLTKLKRSGKLRKFLGAKEERRETTWAEI